MELLADEEADKDRIPDDRELGICTGLGNPLMIPQGS